jgi:hypothetical protein
MTWSEMFENQLKTPGIGTAAWFNCIPAEQTIEASRLVAAKTPVCILHRPSTGRPEHLVVFDGTEFIAGGFDEVSVAEKFVNAWNCKTCEVRQA